jgi:hypothetical protein
MSRKSAKIGVLFFNHGTKHAVRLLVALHSLRKVYAGPVCILDTGESSGIAMNIAAAFEGVTIKQIPFVQYRRHSCYVAKASLWRHSPYPASLLLDSDTLVVKPIDGLLDTIAGETALAAVSPGFFVTRFSDWTTTGNIIGGRIKRWSDVKCKGLDVAGMVKASLRETHAAINTGVLGFRSDAETFPTLEAWERLTQAGWRLPFVDELAAQLLLRKFPHTMLSERFNSSVLYAVDREAAVIVHGHGNKLLRPELEGRWLAEYGDCRQKNLAGVADWAPAGDPALTEWLASSAAA